METNTFENQVLPQNYMALAIISTILGCCSVYGLGFIAGVVGIYFASQVKSRYNQGDYEGALKNSKNAKNASFIAIALFVLGMLITLGTYLFFPEMWAEQMEIIQQAMEQAKEAQ